jgi:glycosyltransferase involved in cell wall biosynthesis
MVVSPHGMLEPWAWRHKWWKKWAYFHLFEKRFLRGADALLATARPEGERLGKMVPGQRVETIPLGIDAGVAPDYEAARAALGWERDERVLLFLSRIHPKKGLDLLLQALARTPAPHPVRLVIVGDGDPSYVAQLQAWAQTHATGLPRIDWIGPVWGEARWRYFQGADLFCLPTHSENFGLVVLEAWQTGTPVLTTPGTPWAADLAGRGYLCEPRIDSIGEALRTFWASPTAGAAQRLALHEWTRQNFAWDLLAPRYLDFYRSLRSPAP